MESGVRSGDLTPGTRLPAVRVLAQELDVSPGTVAAAYRTLRQRGVIETDGRRGTRVRPVPAVASRSRTRLPVPAGARNLSVGGPDPALLPSLRSPLRRIPAGPVTYGSGSGVRPELAELARRRLVADGVPADDLTITSGCLAAVERVLDAHLSPGDPVAVEDPGWANLFDLLAAMGLPVVPVPVDDDGPDPDGVEQALRRGARALVVTSRAQNPFGSQVSERRAARLRGILDRHREVLVVEDDHAAELAAEPLRPLAGATAHWAMVRSVSKPYGPDLRCAVLAGDSETIGRVEGRQAVVMRWVSTILQNLVVALWEDESVAEQVTRAGALYDERRDALVAALTRRGVAAHGRSGLNVWVPVEDETGVCARLLEEGWVVAPGAGFRVRSRPGVRITVAGLPVEDADRLADAIVAATRPARGTYAV
ncbi:DNA-binding transcriptional regulator, MocR family, contains an aminotransferase domain [Actinopolymorpha cephalotaxi]|uniref:DNA-binding transcriptional regulator, MocR family, contains an aminotransferase domain n=1 Tax=Actinopolymorpha cephalotaxi TaxID=504797 RepID=A0A1I2KC57_9ACTN|nr:DNA-binding transcriptional regulator, MocR family, contains an aminotransferase domain [Actinopolymorpha cephalotaxi]